MRGSALMVLGLLLGSSYKDVPDVISLNVCGAHGFCVLFDHREHRHKCAGTALVLAAYREAPRTRPLIGSTGSCYTGS
ncbi:hypothetical protein PR003_g30109 [Phytophthora rubi]|uniref:Secreted protein n=1 Tax=Phytophthora rubi TaxID=129364 RepID=A0A6A4BJN7_9STRA|nr:hypothetical protein PR003_g30109 [Phytophthora rubi]